MLTIEFIMCIIPWLFIYLAAFCLLFVSLPRLTVPLKMASWTQTYSR